MREFTEEHRRKLSEANMGHEVSAETRAKIGLAQRGNTNMRGKKMSDEARAKISAKMKIAMKGKHWKIENGKRVYY